MPGGLTATCSAEGFRSFRRARPASAIEDEVRKLLTRHPNGRENAGSSEASASLDFSPGVGPLVLAEPVPSLADDALEQVEGVGHAGHVRDGVLWY